MISTNTQTMNKTAENLLNNSFISKLSLPYKYKRYLAFTLAEVLIVLLIIGVIASLVIPGIIADTQQAEFKAAWKKTYSDLSQATKRLAMDNAGDLTGVFDGTGYTTDLFRNKFLPYLSYTKLCEAYQQPSGPDGCWYTASNFYHLSGTTYQWGLSSFSRMVLNNGTLLLFWFLSSTCADIASPNHDTCGWIFVDVNGFKGPNKIGKDVFALLVLKNGNVIPTGTQGDTYYNNPTYYSCDVKTYPNTEGWSCSADYLR